MRVLALDTTTRRGSVAVVDGDRVIVEREGSTTRTHTERLPRELMDALSAACVALEAIDVFAVAVGPGSFTGLRTGIAAIQGLAMVMARRVVPISMLEALGQVASNGCAPGALVGAWIDAHRREVFSGLYRVKEGSGCDDRLVEVESPRADSPQHLAEQWAERAWRPAAVAGDGAVLYGEWLPGTTIIGAPPMAGLIGRMAAVRAARGAAVAPGALQPLYVRRPDVEIARDQNAHV
jgi:tRNA threonylcarbamoyladenosine biosynthesis protein TsaB